MAPKKPVQSADDAYKKLKESLNQKEKLDAIFKGIKRKNGMSAEEKAERKAELARERAAKDVANLNPNDLHRYYNLVANLHAELAGNKIFDKVQKCLADASEKLAAIRDKQAEDSANKEAAPTNRARGVRASKRKADQSEQVEKVSRPAKKPKTQASSAPRAPKKKADQPGDDKKVVKSKPKPSTQASGARKAPKKKADDEPDDDEKVPKPKGKPKTQPANASRASKKADTAKANEKITKPKAQPAPQPSGSSKRKAPAEEDDEEDEPPRRGRLQRGLRPRAPTPTSS